MFEYILRSFYIVYGYPFNEMHVVEWSLSNPAVIVGVIEVSVRLLHLITNEEMDDKQRERFDFKST